MGIDNNFASAFAKAQIAVYGNLPSEGKAFISVKDSDKQAALELAKKLQEIGFTIISTKGTAKYLADNGVGTNIFYPTALNEIPFLKPQPEFYDSL